MAAFSSFQYHPFLLDSSFFPLNASPIPIKPSSFIDPPLPPSQSLLNLTNHHQTSSVLDQTSKFTLSDNEPSVTKNQSPQTSVVVDNNKLEHGEQVTQNKRRRNKHASSLTSLHSKEDASGGEGNKKQKKSNNKSEEEKEGGDKPKAEKKKKNQKKSCEEPPTGYIHVRARRGQATDSHSLAERVRREKISERMKMLQRLVPGCDKVTGKALMLDEIINYVQSLQNQVEFLSMKLASVNPMFYDFSMDIDTLMVRPERSNCMVSAASQVPLPSVPHCSGNNQVTTFADTTTTSAFHTTNVVNDYVLDNSASISLIQGQRSNVFCEDGGSQFWDVEDQRHKLFHPYGITNNTLCSFH